MKKQTKTYVLLLIVLLIWGIIAYQVFNPINSTIKEGEVTNTSFSPKKIQQKENFTIVADYRDPFLGIIARKKQHSKSRTKASQKKSTPEIALQYTGYITDTATKKQLFFITINGKQQMLSVHDIAEDVTLLSGSKSKVKIRYNNKIRTILLQE